MVNVIGVGMALDAPALDWSLVMHTGASFQAGENVTIFLPLVKVTWPSMLPLVNPSPCNPKIY